MVLEKTLESPLNCKVTQPVHSKGNQPWVSLGEMMINLKLQYFGNLMGRVDSLEKTLMMGKFEGSRRRGKKRMRCLGGISDSVDTQQTLGGAEGQRSPMSCSSRDCRESDKAASEQEQQ